LGAKAIYAQNKKDKVTRELAPEQNFIQWFVI